MSRVAELGEIPREREVCRVRCRYVDCGAET